MKIILLTHQRELERKTNTGALALAHAADVVERVVWARKEPDARLLGLLECNQAVLLYPAGDGVAEPLESVAYEYVIVIDATWQEARKIYNQSPYLKSARKAVITPEEASGYRLRRNQPQGGLCTAECVIRILQQTGMAQQAAALATAFSAFNQ